MTPESVGPLSRPVVVDRLPAKGTNVRVEATPEECAALAADLKLVELRSLVADFHLSGAANRVRVAGRIRAAITQICVVSLDPFDSEIDEEVKLDFEEPDQRALAAGDRGHSEDEPDPPDEIVGGRIDLGAVTAEFLVLGLDPYPRKPGVDFTPPERDEKPSPFAALGRLKPSD